MIPFHTVTRREKIRCHNKRKGPCENAADAKPFLSPIHIIEMTSLVFLMPEDNPCIERHGTLFHNHERIHIQLLDLREV